MNSMYGRATITFDDGSVFPAEIDIRFITHDNAMSGSGTIVSDDIMAMAYKGGTPIVGCAGHKFRVVITEATSDGRGTIKTSGSPL